MLTTRRAFAVVLTIAAAGGGYVAVRTAQTPRRAPDRPAWTEIAWPFTELVWRATSHGPWVTFGPLKDAKY